MKIFFLVYHEMRHIYQKRAVKVYQINQSLGEKVVPLLESDKKCALWLREMQSSGPSREIEEDADDFACYLTNRYPAQLTMLKTNRRLAAIKRKYDKVEIKE